MKTFLIIALGLHAYVCNAQVVEHFTDENFSSDPLWSGTSAHFIVNSNQQLQLSNIVAGTSYLSTPFTADSIDGFEWEAYVKQSFAPSGSNYGRIYLVSDQSNLTAPLNGYYIQLGEAGSLDAVELFRQSGTVHTSVCRGTNATIASSFAIRVRITRSDTGLWTLYIDYSGGTSFNEEAHGTDATFNAANYFGVVCVYTASNANKFFFDDLLAGPPLGDLSPPLLTALAVLSQRELQLEFSEELDTASISTMNFIAGDSLGNPAMVELLNEQKSVKLTFSSAFLNGRLYTLSINGIRDLALNEMPPEEQSFRYFVPEPAVNSDIIFNELFTDPSPIVGLPSFEFVELFNKSEKAFDLSNWTLGDLTSTATLPTMFILPGEFLIITATAALSSYEQYGPTLATAEMPTLNNASDSFVLRDQSGNIIDSVQYTLGWFQDEDKQLGGYTLERLLPELDTNEPLNWMASEAIIGGTPGSPNSVLGRNPDSKPPTVDTLIVVNQNTLALIFNEAVDTVSLTPVAFKTSAGLVPSMVRIVSHVLLELGFADLFGNGPDDHLVVSGIRDIAGNVMDTTELGFRYFMPGQLTPGVLLFNEIMADPSPTVYLPEAEFIEVINTSGAPFDLQGWTLTDATATVTLPAAIILPHEYLVLSSTTNASKFLNYGPCLGITGFPSLTNSGEPLTLRSPGGMAIDSVFYHQTWLGEGEKADGGWSLERLNFSVVSHEPTNWRASLDSLGGTPARTNSVAGMNPDSKSPSLDSLVVHNENELHLKFSESMDSLVGMQVEHYSVDCIHPAEATVSGLDSEITLVFDVVFENGVDQHLRLVGLKDLAGNEMDTTLRQFRYFIPGEINAGVVLINEIMADPSPTVQLPEAEYIEIVNTSDSPFDLRDWTLTDATDTVALPGAVILPNEYLLLTSTTNAAKFSQYGRYLGVPGFPSLTNAGEPLTLKSPDGVKIDSVFYHQAWLGKSEKADGGWSLERLSFSMASGEPTNWRAAVDTLGGTPSHINSVAGMNPDLVLPVLDSLVVRTDRELVLVFSEPMDSALARIVVNYAANGVIPLISRLSRAGIQVTLEFEAEFENGLEQQLTMSGLKDLAGNAMDTATMQFRYFVPGEIIAGVVLINEIMADPSPVVQLPEAEYIEVVNTSGLPFDLQGWTLTDATDTVALPASIILPHEYLVLTSTTNAAKFSDYGRHLGVPGFPSLTNGGEPLTLRSPEGEKIDSVVYRQSWIGENEKEDGGWSLERLSLSVTTNEPTNWRASVDSLGGTPGRTNSVAGMNPDAKPPLLDSLSVQGDHVLRLIFNEPMDSVVVIDVGHYSVDGIHPADATISSLGTELQLEFETAFENGIDKEFRLAGLKDLAGNEMDTSVTSFRYFVPGEISPGVLLINEIMADPSPVVQLPEAEYIEIVNTSSNPFDLEGWTLTDATDTVALPAGIILPHEYLVLTSTTNALKFSGLAVPGFPSLNNGGEALTLRSLYGMKIDSVFYHQEWLGENEKADGGWSLERLDFSVSSYEPTNWRASIDPMGGTPARPNSVAGMNPDSQPPVVDSLLVRGDHELRLVFSEPMDSVAGTGVEHYSVEGKNAVSAMISPELSEISLLFDTPFGNGADLRLVVSGLKDLAENEMDTSVASFRYFLPGEISQGVLLINEIMTDPSPVVHLPEAEYIEIVNTSGDPFDLLGWTLTDATDTVGLPAGIILPHQYLVLTSTTNASKFSDQGHQLGVPGFPSLNNSGEALILKSPDGMKIDSVFYHQEWLGETEKADGGWSLERLDFFVTSYEPTNWRVSTDTLGGTPGRINSVAGMNPDSKPPLLDSLLVLGDKVLGLVFNEPMDSVVVRQIEHYSVDGVHPADATVSGLGAEVILNFDIAFENGIDKQFRLVGLKDLAGNEIDTTDTTFRYFVPGDARPGVILINEIMADPSPVVQLPEAEYIEVVNTSEAPLDLQGWTLADATDTVTLPVRIILPHEYLVLTSTTNATKFSSFARTFGVPGFPSLNNSGETLTLRSPTGLMIDSVYYHFSWMGDDDKSDGGWSLERLGLSVVSHEPTNWRASVDALGGTPARVNSVAGMNPDSKSPTLDSLSVRGSHQLDLTFSEAIDGARGRDTDNYFLDDKHPLSATISGGGKNISLDFAKEFANGREQQLIISKLRDVSGNEMEDQSFTFMYFVSGEIVPGAILINEIMADPAPLVQLPEAEFIELVNVSSKPFNLEGWKLCDATAACLLPRIIIQPAEFLILTSASNGQKFEATDHAVGVTGFPSLNNSGEPIKLKDPDGRIVDSVNYDVHWYGDDPKRDGGWSLERLRYNYSSTAQINWMASIDVRGGTPGIVNSQFGRNPDGQPPKIESALVADAHTIQLNFSEPIDEGAIGMSIKIDSSEFNAIEWDVTNKVRCMVAHALENARAYAISVVGVKDTAGNVMPAEELTLRYFFPSDVKAKDVIINEIMPDPSPVVGLPEMEYVELFNRSVNPINLLGWVLSDGNSRAVLPDIFIMPNEFLVLTPSAAALFGQLNSIAVAGFPSLGNDGDYLVLKSPVGSRIDSINYNRDWYRGTEKLDGGWSLELIDPLNPCGEEGNWTQSEDETGGTPGKNNSVRASKPDISGPGILSVHVESPQSILIEFDEKLSEDISMVSVTLTPESGQLSIEFGDAALRTIKLLTGEELKLSTPYLLTVANLFDCNGNRIRDQQSAYRFTLPEDPLDGDIVINEVLFNPRPGGSDFIEIYNLGPRYFDLKGWSIARMGDVSEDKMESIIIHRLLAPQTFLVLTTDKDRLLSDYPHAPGDATFEVSLPSMPDDHAAISISDSGGRILDSVAYDEGFHSTLVSDPEGVSLERISMTASSFEPSNWRSAAESAGYATPGQVNSNSRVGGDAPGEEFYVSPEVISRRGADNFALIFYRFDEPGNFINCKVFDQQGHMVKELVNNMSVGLQGFLRWDGDTEDGSGARAGYYMVLLDYFDTEGTAHSTRMRVVIAPR